MEEISYVFLFAILSLPLIFTSVAISIFYFLTAATEINCYVLFFFNVIRLLCYLSQSPSFVDFICRGFIFLNLKRFGIFKGLMFGVHSILIFTILANQGTSPDKAQ